MTNCKAEFLDEASGKPLLCAIIECGRDYYPDANRKKILLPIGFDAVSFKAFMEAIDFDYDDGFGGQEIYGFIWYVDGTWSERGEYDGSEWWSYKKCPSKPDELNQ